MGATTVKMSRLGILATNWRRLRWPCSLRCFNRSWLWTNFFLGSYRKLVATVEMKQLEMILDLDAIQYSKRYKHEAVSFFHAKIGGTIGAKRGRAGYGHLANPVVWSSTGCHYSDTTRYHAIAYQTVSYRAAPYLTILLP